MKDQQITVQELINRLEACKDKSCIVRFELVIFNKGEEEGVEFSKIETAFDNSPDEINEIILQEQDDILIAMLDVSPGTPEIVMYLDSPKSKPQMYVNTQKRLKQKLMNL